MLRHLRSFAIGNSPFRQLQRSYHSKNGVYGYRPSVPKSDFKVSEIVLHSRNSQSNVYRWVEAYRKHGHKLANVDPIRIKEPDSVIQELNPEFYGIQPTETIKPEGLINVPIVSGNSTVQEFQSVLQQIYCGSKVGAEFSYLENLEEREWLALHFEQLTGQNVSNDVRRQIAELLIKSQAWDNFMALKFPTVKRYSGEGAESLLAFYWQLLHDSAKDQIEHLVAAMPHRGRTNLQTILLNLRPVKIFHKLRGESEFPDEAPAMGDILSHFHVSEELEVAGRKIKVSMVRNPSHLEAANPVAMGKTRSKQQTCRDGAFSDDPSKLFATAALNVMVHGDAAFAGQGINQEILNMAYVPHFEVGGTIHIIVNNQIGFTTPGDRGRSTAYASDLAKTIQAPVFHVNGDDPEMVTLITKLAFGYQRRFRKDVFIDLNCFRRWGHNELDDPKFTNPIVYQIIEQRRSVPDLYAENLAQADVLSTQEAQQIRDNYMSYLNAELQLSPSYRPEPSYLQRQWAHIQTAPDSVTYWDTGLDYSLLNYIGQQSVGYPNTFTVHPHLLKTHILGRRNKLDAGERIDWSTAEALAFGSLMYQGHSVRLSGEDVGRGTFSHRHVMLVDQMTNEMFIPLNDLKGDLCGKLEVAHSILSEEAVLGFEYGMAIDNPNNLIIWEAQFGDFANGAQIIIDNFILSGETKWMESNALTILLPHGFDGAGSEHSNCRIERFLQMSDSKERAPDGDNVNVHVVNPTTPAQYYHAVRRQMLRNFRKPLIVVAPKTLLRLSEATSNHADFQPGTFFKNVLGDAFVNPNQVQKVVICSGKHYYNLHEYRQLQGIQDTAILRLESLSPFPLHDLQEEIAKFKNARTFIWSQEEHCNMGAWRFVQPRFEFLIGKQLKYCGRGEGASSATGIGKIHKREAGEVITSPFKI